MFPSIGPRQGLALMLAAALCSVSGCSREPSESVRPESPAAVVEEVSDADGAAGPSTASRARIVVLGDSLTAGLGLSTSDAFPSRLQAKVDAAGYDLEVVNAGVSGDTTAGGLRRLAWALDGDVRFLVVALGANDGLRGLPPARMAENLSAIIDMARKRGITVVLAGMEAPPNFGSSYTNEFRDAYHRLAKEKDVTFIPFLLEGVAGVPTLNQGDGIHPNATGAGMVATRVWGALEPLVSAAGQR